VRCGTEKTAARKGDAKTAPKAQEPVRWTQRTIELKPHEVCLVHHM
jgi:hypothetical protein